MKYLITGGKGFLGSHLTEKLLKEGHEIISFDMPLLLSPTLFNFSDEW